MEDIYPILKDTLTSVPRNLVYLGVTLVMLIIARLIKALTVPFSLREQMTEKDNPALGMSVAGYYLGTVIVALGPLLTPAEAEVPLWQDLLATAGYMLLGLLLLNVSRFIVDKALLYDFSTVKEIVEDRNPGTGAVEMGAYVASGLIIAGAIHGKGGGIVTSIVFFALGQVGLLAYGHIYRLVCRHDVHGEIEKDNIAAGVALGMNLVAIGIIIMSAVAGDFIGWTVQLTTIGLLWVMGTVLLLLLRLLIDYALLPGVNLYTEIVEDRNVNVAWVEGAALTGLAAILAVIL